MSTLQIIGAPQSPFVWACRLAAAEKGIDAENIPARPHSPEVLAINPSGKVPVMRHGDVALFESRAIISYIDCAFEGPALMPRDRAEAIRAEQWTAHLIAEMHPAITGRHVVPYVFPSGPGGTPDRAVIDAGLPAVERHVGVLHRALRASTCLAGEAFTIADVYLLPMLSYLAQTPEGGPLVARAPALARYLDRERSRPSFKATIPPPFSQTDVAAATAVLAKRSEPA